DIIVGFPGETEREFRQTLRFVAASELNYLHVFSYSPRPGTPAADAADRVGGEVMRGRSAELRALGSELSRRFRSSFLGKELEVLGLKERLADGALRALSGNFIDVALTAAPDSLVNQLVRARVTEVSDARVSAAPC